jgi:hypothetical protein
LKFRREITCVFALLEDDDNDWAGEEGVSDHRIRLRGGWACQSASTAPDAPEWITLPIDWGPGNPRRLRLSRRFGRPPIDPARQSVLLELDHARGVQSLLLNGKTLAAISTAKSYYLIPLPEIEERNTLVLEVETARWSDAPADLGPGWGQIALLIRSIDPGPDR